MFISSAPVTKIIQGEWDTGQLVNILKKLHRPKETQVTECSAEDGLSGEGLGQRGGKDRKLIVTDITYS